MSNRSAGEIRMRTRVAMASGLPMFWWDRLRGETEAELEADAAALAGILSERIIPSPLDPSVNLAGMTAAGVRAHFAYPREPHIVKNY